jgi:hypothetical protein
MLIYSLLVARVTTSKLMDKEACRLYNIDVFA